MKATMRKELKIGLILFALFNLVNLFTNNLFPEVSALHFILGGLAGLAFCETIIGILPETTYTKLKKLKKNL